MCAPYTRKVLHFKFDRAKRLTRFEPGRTAEDAFGQAPRVPPRRDSTSNKPLRVPPRRHCCAVRNSGNWLTSRRDGLSADVRYSSLEKNPQNHSGQHVRTDGECRASLFLGYCHRHLHTCQKLPPERFRNRSSRWHVRIRMTRKDQSACSKNSRQPT
jgi:hypothetical protein